MLQLPTQVKSQTIHQSAGDRSQLKVRHHYCLLLWLFGKHLFHSMLDEALLRIRKCSFLTKPRRSQHVDLKRYCSETFSHHSKFFQKFADKPRRQLGIPVNLSSWVSLPRNTSNLPSSLIRYMCHQSHVTNPIDIITL